MALDQLLISGATAKSSRYTLSDSTDSHTVSEQGDVGDATLITDFGFRGETLDAATLDDLLEEQRRAYDIIDMHLQSYLSGKGPPQLRMFIPGEAGVGKSKTVQRMETVSFLVQS